MHTVSAFQCRLDFSRAEYWEWLSDGPPSGIVGAQNSSGANARTVAEGQGCGIVFLSDQAAKAMFERRSSSAGSVTQRILSAPSAFLYH